MLTLATSRLRCSPARRASFTRKSALVKGQDIGGQEPLSAIAHDARNVVAALQLCCDLLAEPGVLSEGHRHFAAEVRAVASASSGLVEQLTALSVGGCAGWEPLHSRRTTKSSTSLSFIDDLAAAALRLKGSLAALAGATINLEMECLSCFGRVRLSQEGLTRILINLTRNAAEAMPQGGRIRVTVQHGDGGSFLDTALPARTVLLCVQDSGPGISPNQIGRIFDVGFTTKKQGGANRGLGLSIVRRLAKSAGGTARVIAAPGGGARFEVELPLIHCAQANRGFVADFPERANLEC